MKHFGYFSIIALLLSGMLAIAPAFSAAAQEKEAEKKEKKGTWSGEANADVRTNFHWTVKKKNSHNLENAGVKVGYKSEKFEIDVSSVFSNEYKIIGQAGGNIRVDGQDTTKKSDSSIKERVDQSSASSLNVAWRPNKKNVFKGYYGFDFSRVLFHNYNVTTTEVLPEIYDFDFANELGGKRSSTHSGSLEYEHSFPKVVGVLDVKFDFDFYCDKEYTVWTTGKVSGDDLSLSQIDDIEKSRYRSTPFSDHNDGNLRIRYTDEELFGVENLDGEFSMNYIFRNLNDHMRAATFINQEWRDSTSARENFRYRTLSVIPDARVKYKKGIYKLDFRIAPDFFSYRLDGDEQKGKLTRDYIALLVDINASFDPWDGHSFNVRLWRSNDRPSYEQICWFPRFSKIYADEIYVGNPDLKNSITTNAKLSYKYEYKRLSVNFDLTDNYQPRKITGTYNNEIINDKEYRVYTWINGGQSNEIKASVSPRWTGDHLTASLTGQYSYYHGISASGSVTRSSDYSIASSLTYDIKTWTFEGNAKYQSGVTRTYYSMSSIIDGNIKISKTFGKHWTVYIHGSNLLDHPVTVETISEDEKEIRYEKFDDYKRLVILGVSFKF